MVSSTGWIGRLCQSIVYAYPIWEAGMSGEVEKETFLKVVIHDSKLSLVNVGQCLANAIYCWPTVGPLGLAILDAVLGMC